MSSLRVKRPMPWIGATGPPGSRSTRDFEVVAIDDWPEAGLRGAEAAWDFYRTISDALERVLGGSGFGEVQQVDAGGDKVLIHHRPDLSGQSGAEVELNYWCVATFRHGKIVREHWFADRADALEAAGPSE
jgi:ketosteroid isomerase-like protein